MEYVNALLAIGAALILGLLSTKLMGKLGLPNVTGYLIVGLIIGPYCLGQFGFFISEEVLNKLSVVSSIALGFIAFSIGVEFKISHVKEIGKSAIVITLFQALTATLLVDLALIFIVRMPVYEGLIMGAIATATAPAATLMVVRQYKAKGKVTGTLLPVVALDDAVGLIVFAVSNAIALSLASGAQLTVFNLAVWPLVEILCSLLVGGIVGFLVKMLTKLFQTEDNRLIAAIMSVFLCVGLCELFSSLNENGVLPFKLSDLLVCMMSGAVFVNTSKDSPRVMEQTDKWTPVVFMLFFILSGAELNVLNLAQTSVLLALLVYLVARSTGKYLGTYIGATLTKADHTVRKYLGITLLPQAGVAIGMATMCKVEFAKAAAAAADATTAATLSAVASNIVTITMCAVLVYELIGPVLTKMALAKAGEIDPSMLGGRHKKAALASANEQTGAQNDDQNN